MRQRIYEHDAIATNEARYLLCLNYKMNKTGESSAFIIPIKLLIWRRLICNRIAFEICSRRHQQQHHQVDTVTHHSNDNVQLNFFARREIWNVHKLHGITAWFSTRYVDVLKLYSLTFRGCVCERASEYACTCTLPDMYASANGMGMILNSFKYNLCILTIHPLKCSK